VKREDVHLEIVSDARLLQSIRGLVSGYLRGFGFSADKVNEVVLAITEACSNSIRHAYSGSDEGVLDLTLHSDDDFFEIILQDRGKSALPEQVARKSVQAPDPESLTPGGLGIQLMYEVFDDVEFTPDLKEGNRVVMRLKRPG
jgi:serine/threonine-protein kinase RsbW